MSNQNITVPLYESQWGQHLNNLGAEIRINIETQDLILQSAEQYLLVEGLLQKNDDSAFADGDLVSLVHNSIMNLFKSISYRISGQQIEHINDKIVDTTMMSLVTYSDDIQSRSVVV